VLGPDGAERDVFISRGRWEVVPVDADGDLTTGTGRRFILDPERRVVRVLTDRLGHFVAFWQP
jgi:hypothetical protein